MYKANATTSYTKEQLYNPLTKGPLCQNQRIISSHWKIAIIKNH